MLLPKAMFNLWLSLVVAFSNSTFNVPQHEYCREHQSGSQMATAKSIFCALVIMYSVIIMATMCYGFYRYKTDIWPALAISNLKEIKNKIWWGATVNDQNHFGLTPLHSTIDTADIWNWNMMRFFLHENARTDLKDHNQGTVLDYALKEDKQTMLLCLLLHGATDYNLHSEHLHETAKDIFSSFRTYQLSKNFEQDRLFTLFTSSPFASITYEKDSEKKYDMVGFALHNKDYKGLEYCIKKGQVTNEEVVMAIADNKQLAWFLLRALESIPFKNNIIKKALNHAHKQDNAPVKQALKNYAHYETLMKLTLHKKIGEPMIIKKILSYIDIHNCHNTASLTTLSLI